MQSSPLYPSYLYSVLLNYDIVDIEKPDGICLLIEINSLLKYKTFFRLGAKKFHFPLYEIILEQFFLLFEFRKLLPEV